MQTMKFEAKIETTSAIGRQLKVSVDPATIQEYMESSFAKVQKTATLKGFRKGKVPLSLVKQYYMGDVKNDVLKRVLNESLWKAVEDNKLVTVGNPEIKELVGGELESGPLTYTAHVEIYPEIQLGKLSNLKIEKFSSEVKPEDIEKGLENLRESHVEMASWGDNPEGRRPVKDGDYVEISFVGTVEGKTNDRLKSERQVVKLGAKRFLPEFEAGIIGMSAGDTKEVSVPFPKDFADDFVAGKTGEFQIKLHELKKATLPALDDEFAKRFKFETFDELKEKVKQSLIDDRQKDAKAKTKDALIQVLVSSHTFDVPRAMVEGEIRFLINDFAERTKRQGLTEKMIEAELKRLSPEFVKHAELRVRGYLLFEKIAKEHSLEPTEADLNREYEEMGKSFGMTAEQVKPLLGQNQDSLNQMKSRIQENKIVDFLLGTVKIG